MRYKVVTTWTVEVTDAEVQRAARGYGKDVNPKQLATPKAIKSRSKLRWVTVPGTSGYPFIST